MRPRAARICGAVAAGLRRLGVAAEFRPRNDIEVHGRKLCGTGGVIDGRTLFFQGTLLAEFDPERMIEALRVMNRSVLSVAGVTEAEIEQARAHIPDGVRADHPIGTRSHSQEQCPTTADHVAWPPTTFVAKIASRSDVTPSLKSTVWTSGT